MKRFILNGLFVLPLILLNIINASGQILVINPQTDGGFEGTHGWVFLNKYTENKWMTGTDQKTAGTAGAYLSNNNSTNTLTSPQTANSRIYLYKDFTIPANATSIALSFKYRNPGTDALGGRCLFEQVSDFPNPMPTNGSQIIMGNQFSTMLNSSSDWTTYTNASPFSTDRPAGYAGTLVPGTSYRLAFEWAALYQTSYTQIPPFCEIPTAGNVSWDVNPAYPNMDIVCTFHPTGGSNYSINWTVTPHMTIISGQGTSQITVHLDSEWSSGVATANISCPEGNYVSNARNSGPLAVDEVSLSYIPTPRIFSFSPLSAQAGESVTISGEYFGETASDNIVYLGGMKCTISDASASSITVVVPAQPSMDNFTVLNTTHKLICTSPLKFIPKNSNLASQSYSTISFMPGVSFSTAFPSSYDQKFVLADCDMDGKPDIVSYSSEGVPQVLRNTCTAGVLNSGTFSGVQSMTGVSPTYATNSSKNILSADLNNDGKPDFASSNGVNDGGFANMNSSTTGTPLLEAFSSITSTTGQYRVGTAFLPVDINLDGRTDIIGFDGSNATNGYLYFSKNTSSGGTFSVKTGKISNTGSYNQKFNNSRFYSGDAGDVDGDGRVDLLLGGTNEVSVLLNTTNQGTPEVTNFTYEFKWSRTNAGGVSYTAKLVDLDLDGKADVVATNHGAGSISVFKNNSTSGNVSMGTMQTIAVPDFAGTYALAAGDMNGDGKPDLIVSDNATRIAYLENTSVSGTISFATAVTVVSGGSAYPQLAILDVDGDNKPDMVAASGSNIVVFRNCVGEAGAIGTSQTICHNTVPAGFSSTSAASFLTGSPEYKWQVSTTSATAGFSDISGATDASYTVSSALTVNTWYRRGASSSALPGNWCYTLPVMVTVEALPTVSSVTPGTNCGTSSVDLSGTCSAGTLNWYTVASGGVLAGSGLTFTTPAISATTTYYAEAITSTGCKSISRTAAVATIITTVPDVLTTTPRGRCDADTVTLRGTTNKMGTLEWYTALEGGSPVGTGNSFITPVISASTTYYASSSNCNGSSTPRQAVLATVVITPSITAVTPGSGCIGSTIVLNATASNSGSLNWYLVASGGTANSGNATITNIQTSATRYVSASNYYNQPLSPYTQTWCESPRTAVSATALPVPAAPTGTGATIYGQSSTTISAVSTNSVKWYSQSTYGIYLDSGSTYTTPVLSASQTYYAAAVNTNGCESSTRTAVAVTYSGPSVGAVADVTALTGSTNQTFRASSLTGQSEFVWQRSLDNGATWVDISANLDPGITYSGFSGTSETTTTLTLSLALSTYHETKYRVKLSHSSGASIFSTAGTLYVADVFGSCSGGGTQLTTSVTIPPASIFSSSTLTTACAFTIHHPSETGYANALWDGNTTSTGVVVSAATPSYIGLDLGTTYLIDKVQCEGVWNSFFPTPAFCASFNTGNLDYSLDNNTWTNIASNINTGTTNALTTFNFAPVSARYVRFTRDNGNTSALSEFRVFQSSATMAPYIRTAPQSNLYIATGKTFTVTAPATPISGQTITGYQWTQSTDNVTYTNVSNGGTISGATTATLTITNFSGSNAKYYKLTATQSGGGCTVSTVTRANLVAPYYTTTSGYSSLQNTSSWTTSSNGIGGSAPGNFTTANDFFILANGDVNPYSPATDWTVTGTVELNGNKLTLGSQNVTLGAVNDGSTSAYVKTNGTGSLTMSVTSLPVLFPLGNSSYDPVSITNRTGTADNFSVKVSDAVLSGGTTGSAMSNVVGRTWAINKSTSNTSPGCDLSFSWQAGDVLGTLSTTDMKLYAWSGSAWVEQNSGVISRTSTSISYAGYTGSLSNALFMVGNPVPAITSFDPESAPAGTTVTITGSGFANTTAVSFGGTAAASYTVVSPTQITAVVGTGASGSVSVTTPGGTAGRSGFTFLQPPVISYFSPAKAQSGQTVTITGSNFYNISSVTFGGVSAASFVVVSPTQITAVLGSGASGTVSVFNGATGSKSGFIYGLSYTSIDVLAGWNQTNTADQVWPYAASYTKPGIVESASQNFEGLLDQSDISNAWINPNSSLGLIPETAPFISFSITTSEATKFDRFVIPGMNISGTSKAQLRWSVDDFTSSLGEFTPGSGTNYALTSVNLITTTTQPAGTTTFRLYFYNGNDDYAYHLTGASPGYASTDGTAPSYDANYAFAVFGAMKPIPSFSQSDIVKDLADGSFTMPSPASSSLGAFSFSSSSTSVATVSGTLISLLGEGLSTLTTHQAATEDYAEGSTTCTLTVKTNPTLSNFPDLGKYLSDGSFTISPPTSNSSGAFSYASSNPLVASVSGNTISILSLGSCTITANQAASGVYYAGSITCTLTITDAPPVISYASPQSYTVGIAISSLSPSSTGGPVTGYTSDVSLPSGLSMDPSTGVITGTPTAITESATYVITATNATDFSTDDLSIVVVDQAPSSLSYNSPNTFTVGTSVSPLQPTISGGQVTSYSVNPDLPSGLSINSQTGEIDGTPGLACGETSFVVTAANATGSTTATVVITVSDLAPAGLSYSSPKTLTRLNPIDSLIPSNTGGTITNYSITPTLPGGLSLDENTGVITGTPTEALHPMTSFVITGTNTTGTVNSTLELTINDAPPSDLTYTSPNVFTKDEAITTLTPTFLGGPVESYSVDPDLPDGLSLNETSGEITGTPTAITSQATYTVTASNYLGSCTTEVVITVNDIPPTGLSYSNGVYTKGTAIVPLSATVSGGAVVSYAISPDLPSGLTLNTLTGGISGTPLVLSALSTYTVTATNTGGSTTATLNITVNDVPPSNLSYSSLDLPKDIPMSQSEPTISGGDIVTWSITPTVPSGLTYNTSTGIIDGTPTSLSSLATYTVTATNSGGSTSATFTIRVYPCTNPTTGGTLSDSQILCLGETPAEISEVTAPTGHDGILMYKWQSTTAPGTIAFADISGATATNYTPGAITQTTCYRRLTRVSCRPDWSQYESSDTVVVWYTPPPTVSTTGTSGITTTSATVSSILIQSCVDASSRGVIYYPYTNTNKLIGDSDVETQDESGIFTTGLFSTSVSGLSPNTRYNLRSIAVSTYGTGYSTRSDFWTLANVPGLPALTNPTATTLDVTINTNGNPAITEFAILDSVNGLYVKADGTRGADAVWQTADTWGTQTLTGLTTGTRYYLKVKARNGIQVETGFGTTASAYPYAKPELTTQAVSSIDTSFATGNGTITSLTGDTVTVRGFIHYVWTGTDQEIGDAGVGLESDTGKYIPGTFTHSLTGLSVNTRYNVRALAENAAGVSYGSRVDFFTLANVPAPPMVNNPSATSLDVTVSPNGNPPATEFAIQDSVNGLYVKEDGTRGADAVWQTAANWGTQTVTGLTTGTNYFFRVKARNGVQIETACGIASRAYPYAKPGVTTQAVSSPDTTFATGNGTITSLTGDTVTVRGFIHYVWTGTDREIGDAGVSVESDTGKFIPGAYSHSLTGLLVNTRHHVRAFAENAAGVSYGARVSVCTKANIPSPPLVNNPSATSLDVTVIPNGNPPETEYAIQDSVNGLYLKADGTRGADTLWQTAASWGTLTVTGLSTGETYYFRVKARNLEKVETLFSLTTAQNTCSNPTSGGTIGSAQIICSGSRPSELQSLSGASNYGGTLEYKWQSAQPADSTLFSDISGTNSASYHPPILSTTRWYRRLARVDCKTDWTGAAVSDTVKVLVDQVAPAVTIKTGVSVTLNSSGYYALQASDLLTSWSDAGIGLQSVTISPDTVRCQHKGSLTVTVTVRDQCSNQTIVYPAITVLEGTTLLPPWQNANTQSAVAGTAAYSPCTNGGTFRLTANGLSSATCDQYHFAYQTIGTTATVIVRLADVFYGGWGGVMMRESLSCGAKTILFKTKYYNPNVFVGYRTTTNGPMVNLSQVGQLVHWMKIQRSGNTFNVYTSYNGTSWVKRHTGTISMGATIYAGMFTERVNPAVSSLATFDHCEVVNYLKTEEGELPDEIREDNTGVALYPNPATEEVSILYSYSGEPVPASLLTVEGRVIKSFVIREAETVLGVREVPAGVYFLRFQGREAVLVRRLVIE